MDPAQPLQSARAPSQASARKRKRVSETSEERRVRPATQAPRSSRRETGEGPRAEARGQAAYFHSPFEYSRTANDPKELGPIIPGEGAAKAPTPRTGNEFFPQAARLFARQGPKGRSRSCIRRHEAGYPVPSWTTFPLGPAVKGHLAPMMATDAHL